MRVTAGASVEFPGSTISSNLVHGTNAPIGTVLAPTPNNDPFVLGNHAENNQNLRLGAGVRLVGAAASSVTQSNITDNAFGVLNTTLDGIGNNTATPVAAQNDYWGLRPRRRSRCPRRARRSGRTRRAPWAATFNPPIPENPVNGAAAPDANCPAGVMDSDSVYVLPLPRQHAVGHGRRRMADPRRRRSRKTTRRGCTLGRPAGRQHPDVRLVLRDGARRPRTPVTASPARRRRRRRPAQLSAYMQAVKSRTP